MGCTFPYSGRAGCLCNGHDATAHPASPTSQSHAPRRHRQGQAQRAQLCSSCINCKTKRLSNVSSSQRNKYRTKRAPLSRHTHTHTPTHLRLSVAVHLSVWTTDAPTARVSASQPESPVRGGGRPTDGARSHGPSTAYLSMDTEYGRPAGRRATARARAGASRSSAADARAWTCDGGAPEKVGAFCVRSTGPGRPAIGHTVFSMVYLELAVLQVGTSYCTVQYDPLRSVGK